MYKPAFLIAATRSGAGKTTLTLGIMAALVGRGYRVQPFKCGPDFIDPTLHQIVTGTVSYNIDLQMMGAAGCRAILQDKAAAAEIIVLEGVMGLFDGGLSSTAEIAKTLAVPVFLIVDAQACAQSAAAVLKGFEDFDPQVRIAGVIFNRIGSSRHRELIEEAVLGHCRTAIIGWIPRDDAFVIAERHLGLHMGTERPLDDEALIRLVKTVEDNLDLATMIDGGAALTSPTPRRGRKRIGGRRKIRIGVADDKA